MNTYEKRGNYGMKNGTVNSLVESSVFRFPERPALWVQERSYTYSELYGMALSLVSEIDRSDPAPAIRFGGVLASRSVDAYSAILALLFSGKAYVPLNPKFPTERNKRIADISGFRVLIVGKEGEQAARELLPVVKEKMLVVLSGYPCLPDWTMSLPNHRFVCLSRDVATLRRPHPVEPEDTAYILFTSGSTGVPKGVPITHRNVVSYLSATRERYKPTERDRFSQYFDLTFDLSVHDMFLCWSSGACLYSLPEMPILGLRDFIRNHELTFWFTVPSTVGFMRKLRILKKDIFPSLRWSLFCGEPLSCDCAQAWQDAAVNSVVENLYGPTEATIAITAYRWIAGAMKNEISHGIVPIGAPFPGQYAMVADNDLAPLPGGSEGELCLAGSQLSPGYWRNPSETTARFADSPGEDGVVRRWYRTGDLVRWDRKSGLIYLGRLDRQIKILGFRVEIQEVEHVIRQVAATDLVAVLGWPRTESGADGLVAFVSGSSFDSARIIAGCRERLPDYMVPKRIIEIDSMPLNSNGKIDYRALEQSLEKD